MKSVIKINNNEEEGIIKDGNFSDFETLDFSQQYKFPYCLVGKTQSEFKAKQINKCGVGILIGPSIVLTAGHNLTNICKETGKLQIADSVSFTVGANGDFEPFETVSSTEFYIPDGFIQGIKDQIAKNQLLNDWAIVYLTVPIGETVKILYNLEHLSYVKTNENGLFSYFNENTNMNLKILAQNNPEISIIGYSEFKEESTTQEKDDNSNFYNNPTPKTIKTAYNSAIHIPSNSISKVKHDIEESNTLNTKDININIQISTKEEGLVKSSIFSNNLNKLNIMKLDNNSKKGFSKEILDYVILNSENKEVNNKFNEIRVKLIGKSCLSESKGRLDDFEEALKYKISTYKGQSGSPIFLRIKKEILNEYYRSDYKENSNTSYYNSYKDNSDDYDYDNNNATNKEEFAYIFIGIHSRRGPLLYDNIIINNDNFDDNKNEDYDDENVNTDVYANLTSNSQYNAIGNSINNEAFPGFNRTLNNNLIINNVNDEEFDKVETQVKKMKSSSIDNRLSLNNSFTNYNEKKVDSKNVSKGLLDLVAMHGICEFNEGLLLMGNNILPISSAVEKRKYSNTVLESLKVSKVDNKDSKDVNTKLNNTSPTSLSTSNAVNNENNQTSNISKKIPKYQITYYNKEHEQNQHKSSFCNVTLSLNGKPKLVGLFKKDIKMEVLFTFAKEIMNIDINYISLHCFKGKTKKILNGKFDDNKQLGIFLEPNQFSTIFNIDISMSYGTDLGKRVLEKYMENYDLDIEKIRINFKKKHMRPLFDSIFDEIAAFSDIHPTFGKLFAKIRAYVLEKIGITSS